MTKKLISMLTIIGILVVSVMGVSAVEKSEDLLFGDANGDGTVNITDASAIQRYNSGTFSSGDIEEILADVNKDKIIDIIDATLICKHLCEITTENNLAGNIAGNYLVDYERDVLDLINKERSAAGLKPLKIDERLTLAARERAAEIGLNFSHNRPDGSLCSTAVSSYPMYIVGENIASGYTNPEWVMEGWMNSPLHKENILRDNFECVGIGCLNIGTSYYWVQFFGSFY